ncbi:MAG: ROK family transcriptional regulator [Lachnospiraceae bacterium]|nr:ROK family transcriptional regulator [Lachnospiraceae bacterium]
MIRNGINMGQVKKQNRSLVLRYMNSHEGVSRKEIAEATGLTAAAVTQICNDFLEMGIIKECGIDDETSGAGRRKVKLSINSEYGYILGINIESDVTNVVVANLAGEVKKSIQLDTCSEDELDSFIDKIESFLNEIYESNAHFQDKMIGGCVAVAGEVDKEKGTSVHAYGIWDKEVSICEMLEDKLGIHFIIENNIDAFATAEIVYGTAAKYDNILVIKWGPGVGCSIIIDGKIYEGRNGRSAELGHNIVEQNGIKCSCGRRGCLETKISWKAMQAKRKFKVSEFGDVYRDFADEIDLFARTVVNTMSILEPDRVVLSGKLFEEKKVRDELIKCCESYFKKFNNKRILYTPLARQEDYIGPIATYIDRELF